MGSKKSSHKERKRSRRDRRPSRSPRSSSSESASRSESDIYERRRKRPHHHQQQQQQQQQQHQREDSRDEALLRKDALREQRSDRRRSPSEETHGRAGTDSARYSSYREDKLSQRPAGSDSRSRDELADRHKAKDRGRSATPEGRSQEHELTPEIDDGKEKLSMSIEETNRLRAKLGLKPLQIEGEGDKKKDDENKEVLVRTENISEKKEAETFREKIRTMREKQMIKQKYEKVKGLADSDDEDASTWIEKSRALTAEKAKAAKREKMLQEMENDFGLDDLIKKELKLPNKEYSAKDLKGIEILHSKERIKEGQTVVLTLKDRGILEDGDDVLENVNLVDDERVDRSNLNKKLGTNTYNPYDDADVDEFGIVHKKNVLSKYDEEISGAKKESFKIGVNKEERKQKELEAIRNRLQQKQKESLVLPTPSVALDYLTGEEMAAFKKPKKKVRKLRKREVLKADDLLELAAAEGTADKPDHGSRTRREADKCPEPVAAAATAAVADNEDDLVGPDTDLSNIRVDDDLPEQKYRDKLNKSKSVMRPEDSIHQVVSQISAIKEEPEELFADGVTYSSSMVLNATAEFCRTLGSTSSYVSKEERSERQQKEEDEADVDEVGEGETPMEEEEEQRNTWAEVDPSVQRQRTAVRTEEKVAKEALPILEEEPNVSFGVAGALKLAMKKGYIDDESKNNPAAVKTLQDLQAKNYTIEEKYYDDEGRGRRGGGGNHYHGPVSDFKEKSNYRPDVKLDYIDDSGRVLNHKEAFRYLSHKFHGKGSGKNKIDKRQKKIEQLTKLEQMSSVDTPLNTLKLLQEKQKQLQTPYIMLSGGAANTLTGPSGLSKK